VALDSMVSQLYQPQKGSAMSILEMFQTGKYKHLSVKYFCCG